MINMSSINNLQGEVQAARELQLLSEMNKIQCLYQDKIDIDKQFKEV